MNEWCAIVYYVCLLGARSDEHIQNISADVGQLLGASRGSLPAR